MTCGGCVECVRRALSLLSGSREPRRVSRTVTKEQLERHAKRYGWEQVAETAAQLGVEMTAPKKETDRDKAARARKDHAWRLYEEGRTPDEISRELGLGLSTVKKYLANP